MTTRPARSMVALIPLAYHWDGASVETAGRAQRIDAGDDVRECVVRLRSPAPAAALPALTVQLADPLFVELWACMNAGSAELPDGIVVLKPPPSTLCAGRQVAMAVPPGSFGSVTGGPGTYCSARSEHPREILMWDAAGGWQAVRPR